MISNYMYNIYNNTITFRKDPVETAVPPRARVNFGDADEDLMNARRRAERAITEETFFDSRGSRVPKSAVKAFDDMDDEVLTITD